MRNRILDVTLTEREVVMLMGLVRNEVRSFGVTEGMDRRDWPRAPRGRISKLYTIMRKLARAQNE